VNPTTFVILAVAPEAQIDSRGFARATARALGIEFTIDVRPAAMPIHNVTKRAQANNLVGSFYTDEAEILVAVR
jgi:hypothetical protein